MTLKKSQETYPYIYILSSNNNRLLNITICKRFALTKHLTIRQPLLKQQILLLDPHKPIPLIRHTPFHDILEALTQRQRARSNLATVDKLVARGLSGDGFDGQERSGGADGDDFGEGRAFGPLDLTRRKRSISG